MQTYKEALEELQRKLVEEGLVKTNGNACMAADCLGVHRNTFLRWCRQTRLTTPGKLAGELTRAGFIQRKRPKVQKPQPRFRRVA